MNRNIAVALSFLALIAVGAVALSLPVCHVSGTWNPWINAVFTAFSAVCVTGLSVVEIAAEYNRVGQVVLLVLVELGCLGLIMCGTFLMVAIGRRLSLSSEFSLMNAYGVEQVKGVKGLVLWVLGSMLFIEAIGAAVLYGQLGDVYRSIFFSVMSFCNAGFSILPGSISSFAARPYIVLVMASETILGSLGFLVIFNLLTYHFLRRDSGAKGRLSLQSRIVLRFTGYLLVTMFVLFLVCEWHNTLQSYGSVWQKMYIAFYQAVTPRTCGFTITPTADLHPLTRLLYEVMMFIGGAPGSAAAGIKVTTFAVLIYTLSALCRGDPETIIDRRTVPIDIVREALVITTALSTFAIAVLAVLAVTDAHHIPIDHLFFEALSAVTTTGLSVGDTTAKLSLPGKCVIMIAMFMGRLGALQVVMMIGDREVKRHIRYPVEEMVLG